MNIEIEAIENKTYFSITEYKLNLELSNDVSITKKLSENELNKLLDDIQTVLGYKKLMELFSCELEDARQIANKHKKRECENCDLKYKECYRCCLVCESPLETSLLKALAHNSITCELQLRINKDGSTAHYPEPVNPDIILTLPDFYIETENKKICVYTDGHTYHERTEYQAVRDRSIDRDLQNLGFEVLRFTTSEVNQHMDDKVIPTIKKTMGM